MKMSSDGQKNLMRNKPKKPQKENLNSVDGRDTFQTPDYAVELLVPFIPRNSIIWERAAGYGKMEKDKNIIIHADSYHWMRQQPNNCVDAVITDYVYGTEFPMNEFMRICKGNIITFCASEDEPFIPTERAYWIKTPSTKNYSRHLGRFVEKIYIFRQGNTFNKLHWSQMTGVYTDLVVESDGHQWRKPLSLVERLVRIYTNLGDRVLDPYMGSGTTIEACKNLGRPFVGIDIDIDWVKECKRKFL